MTLRSSILFLLALAGCSVEPEGETHPSLPPNILLLIADDLGNADLGYRGSPIETPNLDALAAGSVRLDRFYVHPVCTPTRAALHIGRAPGKWVYKVPAEKKRFSKTIPSQDYTLPERFAEAGYATALIGKWHLGSSPAGIPSLHGYQYSYGLIAGLIDYWTHRWSDLQDWHRNGVQVEEEGYATHLIGRDASRWIRARDRSKPFFLNVSFNAPHSPIQALPATIKKYRDAGLCAQSNVRCTYMAMIDTLDVEVGRIIATLESEGLRDNTLIVFFSDNGGTPFLGADNSPYRGTKGDVFEGGVRVPAFIHWPGVLRPFKSTQRSRVIDLYATLEEAAGLPRRAPIESRSIWQSISTGKTLEREPFYWDHHAAGFVKKPPNCPKCPSYFFEQKRAMLTDQWKLVTTQTFDDAKRLDPESFVARLFKIDSDPYESTDLAAQNPQRVEEMLSAIDCWVRKDCAVVESLR